MNTVLVVDDDPDIREQVCEKLNDSGYKTLEASTGEEAVSVFAEQRPDLVVLDVMLEQGGLSGIDVCREILKDYRVPIIFLSVKGDEIDRLRGLEEGAIRYVSKSQFSPRELVAEIDAFLRLVKDPGERQEPKNLQYGNLRADLERREIYWHEEVISLGPIEYTIVTLLLANTETVYEWEELKKHVYGHDYKTMATIKSTLRNIRQKFKEKSGEDPIEIVHGVGPRLAKVD
jgi:DNA-binding response OmpR family regulator